MIITPFVPVFIMCGRKNDRFYAKNDVFTPKMVQNETKRG